MTKNTKGIGIFNGIPTEIKITVELDKKTIALLVENAFIDASSQVIKHESKQGELLFGMPKCISKTVRETFRVIGALPAVSDAYKQIRRNADNEVEDFKPRPSLTEKLAVIYEDTKFHTRIVGDHIFIDILFSLPQKYRHSV